MSFETMGYSPEEQVNREGASAEKEIGGFGIDKEVEEEIMKAMEGGYDDSAARIARKNNVSEEVARELAKQDILNNFGKRNHRDALDKISFYKIENDFMNSEAFVELAKERVKLKLSQGDVRSAQNVLSDLNIDGKFLESEGAVKAAESGIQSVLSVDDVNKAIEIQKAFNIDDGFMEAAAKAEIKMRLLKELINGAISLQEKFNISQDFMDEAIKEEIIARLSFGSSLNNIANFVSKAEINVSSLDDERIKKALKARIDSLEEAKSQEPIPTIFKELVIAREETGKVGENS
jgi:hypothetical protein